MKSVKRQRHVLKGLTVVVVFRGVHTNASNNDGCLCLCTYCGSYHRSAKSSCQIYVLNKLILPVRTSSLAYSITITNIREREITYYLEMQIPGVSQELAAMECIIWCVYVIIGKLKGGVLFKLVALSFGM